MYFFTIVQSLVEWGYTRDDDVRGAPYDWRKAPSKQQYIHQHTQKQPYIQDIQPMTVYCNSEISICKTLCFYNSPVKQVLATIHP